MTLAYREVIETGILTQDGEEIIKKGENPVVDEPTDATEESKEETNEESVQEENTEKESV